MISQGSRQRGLLGKLGMGLGGIVAIGTFALSAEAGHRHHRHYCRHHGWTQNLHHHPHNYVPAYQVVPAIPPSYGGPGLYGYGPPF